MAPVIQYEMAALLKQHGAQIRGRNRANCPRCGRFRAIAFTEETFFCHGIDCGWKGNTVTLAKELGFYQSPSSAEYGEVCRRRDAAERLARAVHARRMWLLDVLRKVATIERLANELGPDHEASWTALDLVNNFRPELLAELAALENASAPDVFRFMTEDDETRQAVLHGILMWGGLDSAEGTFVEVSA